MPVEAAAPFPSDASTEAPGAEVTAVDAPAAETVAAPVFVRLKPPLTTPPSVAGAVVALKVALPESVVAPKRTP